MPIDSVPGHKPDPALVRLMAQAHRYQEIFLRGGRSISAMAEDAGVGRSYFTRVLRLSFLDPGITRAILLGRQPIGITTKSLTADSQLPLRWSDQRVQLRFQPDCNSNSALGRRL